MFAVDELPGLDKPNGPTLGRILGRGNVGHAEEGPGGRMRATVRINPDELVWDPVVLVLPHAGELELINDDLNTHCAVLPSNGDTQFIWLVNHSRGTANLKLDSPGYYWYGSRALLPGDGAHARPRRHILSNVSFGNLGYRLVSRRHG